MKLCRNTISNIIHILDPTYQYGDYSFCGLVSRWSEDYYRINNYKFFNGSTNEVNCGTCKVMAQNHIIRKLKGENYE